MTSAWKSATVQGRSGNDSSRPSLVWISRRWSVKSKSTWTMRLPYGMGEVVSPRQVT